MATKVNVILVFLLAALRETSLIEVLAKSLRKIQSTQRKYNCNVAINQYLTLLVISSEARNLQLLFFHFFQIFPVELNPPVVAGYQADTPEQQHQGEIGRFFLHHGIGL